MNSMYQKADSLPYLKVKICPHCEQLILKTETICPLCNYNLVGEDYNEKNIETSDTNIETQENNETVENDAVFSSKPLFCTNCGFQLQPGQKYCGKCGSKVVIGPEKKICFSCNKEIEVSLAFCPYCGTKQDQEPQEETNKPQEELNNSPKTQTTSTASLSSFIENKIEPEQDDEPIAKPKKEKKDKKKVKKIVFASIQLFLTILFVAILLFVPLLTKDSFVNSIGPLFKTTSTENFMTGYKFLGIISSSGGGTLDVGNTLYNAENEIIYAGITTKICDILKISANSNILLNVGFVVITIVYAVIAFAYVLLIISSIITYFIKKPFEGKVLLFTLIVELFALVLIYPNHFFGSFKGYDTWLLYVFVLTFVFWFVAKIAFLKDVREYNSLTPKKKKKKDFEFDESVD